MAIDKWIHPAKLPKTGDGLHGLAIYRRLYGHSYIPLDYEVPDAKPWPIVLRGKPLGTAITVLRAANRQLHPHVEKSLEVLGFVWSYPLNRKCARCFLAHSRAKVMVAWSVVLAALARFRELHGHVFVREGWPVPRNDPSWPKEAWGIDLAHAAHTLEVHAYMLPTPQLRTALSLDVVNDIPLWADILDMFTIYYERYGAADIPIDYVIRAIRKRKADASAWPAKYDGIPLGEVAMRVWLVYIQLPSHRIKELKSVRFAFNTPASWATVGEAKAMFAKINGHENVPARYAVPPDDTAWPSVMHGMRLGHYLHLQAKADGVVEHQTTKPIDLFADAWNRETDFDRHVLGLKIYKRGFKNKTAVAQDFVVPRNDTRWPRKIWGLRLGDFVARLRSDGASLSALERATVNDIGFEWDPAVAASWPDIVQTLTQWHATYPGRGWPDAFVFASEWPPSVVGQTLGYILTLLEVHEDFATTTHRHTLRRLLLDVEKRWTTKVVALTAYYSLHGHLRVPLDYVVPTDDNWPPAATGMPLGVIVALLRRVPSAMMPYVQRRELEALAFEWDITDAINEPAPNASDKPTPEVTTPEVTTPEVTTPESVATVDVAPAKTAKTVDLSAEEAEAPHVITIDDDDDSAEEFPVNWAMWAVALTQFKAHEGHVDIPSDYVVGADDVRWPVALRSFPVGPILANVRSRVVVPPTWVQSQVEIVGVDLSDAKEACRRKTVD